jgi:ketosteroid isomerase-like protein
MKVEGQLRDAVLQGDTEALNRLYSDDYITTNALGAARTKAELLDEFRNGTLRFESINDDDLKVHVSGDTAVVTGQRTQKSWWKGQDTSGQYRYIRVLVKRRGHWQPIAFQATTISHQ